MRHWGNPEVPSLPSWLALQFWMRSKECVKWFTHMLEPSPLLKKLQSYGDNSKQPAWNFHRVGGGK